MLLLGLVVAVWHLVDGVGSVVAELRHRARHGQAEQLAEPFATSFLEQVVSCSPSFGFFQSPVKVQLRLRSVEADVDAVDSSVRRIGASCSPSSSTRRDDGVGVGAIHVGAVVHIVVSHLVVVEGTVSALPCCKTLVAQHCHHCNTR